MTRVELFEQIKKKKSFLCVGLDTDINKIPKHLLSEEDPIFAFNKAIIDATKDYCVAYKPNLAFYEKLGPAGWDTLKKTVDYIPNDIFTIADAKRGDIGNTAKMYAETFFDTYNFDSVTVAPYMGKDSVQPFIDHEGKWTILLALTSNVGAQDFQMIADSDEERLFETVLRTAQKWGNQDNLMFVVGATRGSLIEDVRKVAPDNFLLVPGVGAQGGSLQSVAEHGMNEQCGLLVNSSRGIIYAGSDEDFGRRASEEASSLQREMQELLVRHGLL